MTEQEKDVLCTRYGHCKFLFFVHLFARYVKDAFRRRARMRISGENNRVPYQPAGCEIQIFGNNNLVDIHPSVTCWGGVIAIGDRATPVHNCVVKIGKNSSAVQADLSLFEDGSRILIGENCLLSWGVYVWATDRHAVYAQDSKCVLNRGTEVIIEDHVWVGMNALILKNSRISKNSVVGAHAVVSKKITEENCVIAGNPARVVKRGINWSGERPKNFKKEGSVTTNG